MRSASRHPRRWVTLVAAAVAGLIGVGCGEDSGGLEQADVETTLPRAMNADLDPLAVSDADCVDLSAANTRCFVRGEGPQGPFELPVTVVTRDGSSVWEVAEPDLDAARNGTARRPLALGEAVTVVGEGGQRVGVRVTGTRDPLRVSYREVPPQPGSRYVGVQITLSNQGIKPYSDTPLSAITLRLADGELLVPVPISGGPCRADSLARVYSLPGEREKGCAAFEVPDRSRPARVAVEVASSNRILEWALPGASEGD